MANAKFYRKAVVVAKIEATYGIDSVPTTADGMLVKDCRIEPMAGEDVSRDLLRPYMSAEQEIPVGVHVKIEMTTELAAGGAAGTAPKWGVLARACGLAQTISAGVSVTYSPVSAGHESVSLYFYADDILHKAAGVRGTGVIGLDANQLPVIRWTLHGLFTTPTDAAGILPTFTGWQVPRPATKTNTPAFTLNAVAAVLRNFSLDLGNKVERRFLVGKEEILIVDKAEMAKAQIEALPLATFNPYTLAQAQTLIPVVLVHGTAAGNIVTLNMPAAQVKRPGGYAIEQDIFEWPLELVPLPSAAGNDQFTIVCT